MKCIWVAVINEKPENRTYWEGGRQQPASIGDNLADLYCLRVWIRRLERDKSQFFFVCITDNLADCVIVVVPYIFWIGYCSLQIWQDKPSTFPSYENCLTKTKRKTSSFWTLKSYCAPTVLHVDKSVTSLRNKELKSWSWYSLYLSRQKGCHSLDHTMLSRTRIRKKN